jgi:ferritin-like metal-binding protein YciE
MSPVCTLETFDACMKIKTPTDLLADQLRDLFSVEKQVAATMPELAANAPEPALRALLASQEQASMAQRERVVAVSRLLGSDPGGDESKAMKGLIEGGDSHIKMAEGDLVTTLILVAHVTRIVHYQVGAYEFAVKLASKLKFKEAEELLQTSLDEETLVAGKLDEFSNTTFTSV